MPQAQDPMVLIVELVKALNLYSNPGVGNHSHVNKNSNARDTSKNFWMQKVRFSWVFLTCSLCFIALLFVTIVLWFLFSLFLGFALHYICAFHSRLFFILFKLKKKKKKKGSKLCFAFIFLALKTRLVNLFTHSMSLYLV